MRVIERGGLRLAMLIPARDRRKGATFYSPDDDFIQVGIMGFDAGRQIPPHSHNVVSREVDRTQEVVHVLRGRVRSHLYSEARELVETIDLGPGDTLVLLHGGHSYEVLEDDTFLLEVKNGPYPGPDVDRMRFEPPETAPRNGG